MTDKPKKITFKQLKESFWALSRQRQEAFLKALYSQSSQNKNLFMLWVGKDGSKVLANMKKDIQKETIQRIGRYRKLRLSKINEILRNAEKCSLPILSRIELQKETWRGMLAFIVSKKYLPERYQAACARQLEKHIKLIQEYILETEEQKERLTAVQNLLQEVISKGYYLPYIEDVYLKYFHK